MSCVVAASGDAVEDACCVGTDSTWVVTCPNVAVLDSVITGFASVCVVAGFAVETNSGGSPDEISGSDVAIVGEGSDVNGF